MTHADSQTDSVERSDPPVESSGQDRRLDLGFVLRGLGYSAVLILALVPAVFGWAILPVFGLMFVLPPVVMFAVDRRALLLWAAFVWSYFGFVIVRRFADETLIPWQTQYVILLERIVSLGHIPTVVLQEYARHPYLDVAASWVYASFFPAPFLAAFALWYFRRQQLPRLVVAALVSYCAGLIVFFLVPTVPPWMASANGAIPTIDRIFMDTMFPASPQIMDAGYRASANDVAAMPSIHMATTVLAALALKQMGRIGGVLGLLYCVGMVWAIVYLGEHYIVDAFAGAALAAGAWVAAGRMKRFGDPGLR